jgi:hypothetical protein
VKSITPRGTDKLYKILANGKNGPRLRTAEKIVTLCRKAWRVIHRLYPHEFDTAVPNPWVGVTLKSRVKLTKPAVTRDQVYRFALGCIEHGQPECAAVAVICFEWLQRPENVIDGHISWSGYRNVQPSIRVCHHKTGEVVDHPLEEILADGSITKFYADAEEVLSHLPRRGIPMVLRDIGGGNFKSFSISGMEKIVQRMRKKLGLSDTFTLDACRHGGITELEEAELTDGQGRALSTHRTQDTYVRYAKRTAPRILSATRKRYAHRLANQTATSIQNEPVDAIQNGNPLESRRA